MRFLIFSISIMLLLVSCNPTLSDTPDFISPLSTATARPVINDENPSPPAPTIAKPDQPVDSLTPLKTPNSFEPGPGDELKQRSAAFVDNAQLLILESYPIQVNLQIKGSLPTPCHILRVAISPPDKENHIAISVYSLVDPAVVCIQVLQEFETSVPLGAYPYGHYLVYVNDMLVGEFDG